MKDRPKIVTKSGYDYWVILSLLQKAIRRNDLEKAVFAASELWDNYEKSLWRRLVCISCEDCDGSVCLDVIAFKLAANEDPKNKGLYICKAVLTLCRADKSRDACYLACCKAWNDNMAAKLSVDDLTLPEIKPLDKIPDYVYDVHTLKGKMAGKTVWDMIVDEFKALEPKSQTLLFGEDADWTPFKRRLDEQNGGRYSCHSVDSK